MNKPSLDFEKTCRTCLSESSVMKNVFIMDDINNLQYHKMLMSFTEINIIECTPPVNICMDCATQISKTFSFKKQCEEVDVILRQYIENSYISTTDKMEFSDENQYANNIINCGGISNHSDSNDFDEKDENKVDSNNSCLDENECQMKIQKSDVEKINSNNSKEFPKIQKTKISSVVFECKKCDFYFLSWQELDKHNSLHVPMKYKGKLCCKYCKEVFSHQRHVTSHIRKVHHKCKQYQCGYCGEIYKDMQTLKLHLNKHSIGDFFSVQNTKISANENTNEINEKITDEANKSDNIVDDFILEKNERMENKSDQIANNPDKEIIMTVSEKKIISDSETNATTIKLPDIINYNIESSVLKKDNNEINNHCITDHKINPDSKDYRHECMLCNKLFKASNDLKRHLSTHDPDKPFHCQFGRCRWSFPTNHELIVHINVNHSNGKHECHFCHKIFSHSRNLRQHMSQHQITKRFECKHCNKGFNLLHHLKNHERIHTGDLPFLCQKCGRAFATKDRLIFHLRRHSDVRPFACNECSKTFISKTDLKVHTKTHIGDRPFMCSVCGKTFTTRYNLNKHMRLHHNTNMDLEGSSKIKSKHSTFSCNICGFVAKNIQQQDKHMKSHTCQYFCPLCEKSFSLTTALEAHIKTHTTGERTHVCNLCGWAFNRSEHLRTHIARKHTNGEKSFACMHCSCTFSRAPDLTAHLRIHNHERPYICSECGRGFTQSGALRIHTRIHSGEKPYICGFCHKAHRSAGALSIHMRTHCSTISIENPVEECINIPQMENIKEPEIMDNKANETTIMGCIDISHTVTSVDADKTDNL